MAFSLEAVKQHLARHIGTALGQTVAVDDIATPPNPALGDFAVPMFKFAKAANQNPVVLAQQAAAQLPTDRFIATAVAAGPYVNITLNASALGKAVFTEIARQGEWYGINTSGSNKKVIVEFACPNVNKAFHIGHLRNIVTGEAIVRLLENSRYRVTRANYQGDVGMHIAKSIWGIQKLSVPFQKVKREPLAKRVALLGRAYAKGAQAYETNEKVKTEINDINRRLYERDATLLPVWKLARQWSLQYFETIYKRVHSKFDYYFFESEMAERGVELVQKGIARGIFKQSDGAVIFEGSKHDLHDRVFINSQGFPTYEAKDVALAETWFKKFKPALAIHVVGKEQTEYFKVVFKAIELTVPQSAGKERHVPYGWVHLKGGKMSSRLGNVVTGEELLETVKKEINKLAKKTEVKNKEKLAEDVTIAAVKYAMLKGDVSKDIAFDMEESVSTSGNSGPYLLYTYARIQSIVRKSGKKRMAVDWKTAALQPTERRIIVQLAQFPHVAAAAARSYNPALLAQYAFDLAQLFNDYYHTTPVLQAPAPERAFRLALVAAVAQVLRRSCYLLGFPTVERM